MLCSLRCPCKTKTCRVADCSSFTPHEEEEQTEVSSGLPRVTPSFETHASPLGRPPAPKLRWQGLPRWASRPLGFACAGEGGVVVTSGRIATSRGTAQMALCSSGWPGTAPKARAALGRGGSGSRKKRKESQRGRVFFSLEGSEEFLEG